jgi:hypothetical protein
MKGAIGFRAKTGRAIAVGVSEGPELVWRGEVRLVDDSMSLDTGPYHTVMELPWNEAVIAVQPLVDAIQAVSDQVLSALLEDMQSRGIDVQSVAVVGSPPRDLSRIGNYHIRAHAAEGVLFREVLVASAGKHRLRVAAHSEEELKSHVAKMKPTLTKLGRAAGPPWRADERLAACAALLALLPPVAKRRAGKRRA